MIVHKSFPSGLTVLLRRLGSSLPLWITLLLIAAALANVAGLALGGLPGWTIAALDRLSGIAAVFLGIVIEAAPFLLLGTLASGIVEAFVNREDLARWLPRAPLSGALAGSLIGLFFPVCECGVVPFARRLMRKGAPPPVAIAALLAVPVLNPIVLASTLAAFGPGLVFWGRIGLTLAVAVITALLATALNRGRVLPALEHEEESIPHIHVQPTGRPPFKDRARQALLVAVDEFFEMSRFLVLGAALAALMQAFVRQSALAEVGQGPVTSVLAMTALAVLLSICSTVDAFIALAFSGAFTGGAVLAFLVYGPMVDIKSVLMYLRAFDKRTVAALVLIPLLLTLTGAVAWNLAGWGG